MLSESKAECLTDNRATGVERAERAGIRCREVDRSIAKGITMERASKGELYVHAAREREGKDVAGASRCCMLALVDVWPLVSVVRSGSSLSGDLARLGRDSDICSVLGHGQQRGKG